MTSELSYAAIESSFRRLMTLLDEERAKVAKEWAAVIARRDALDTELAQQKKLVHMELLDTKREIEEEKKRLMQMRSMLSPLVAHEKDRIDFLVGGQKVSAYKPTLMMAPGSALEAVTWPEIAKTAPRDSTGRFIFDVDPEAFGLILSYLRAKRAEPSPQYPAVPEKLRYAFDFAVNRLNILELTPHDMKINPYHGTSLQIQGSNVTALMHSWQAVTTNKPCLASRDFQFHVDIVRLPESVLPPAGGGGTMGGRGGSSPSRSAAASGSGRILGGGGSSKGGLCIGMVAHIPSDKERSQIRFEDGVVYNSGNGLMGGAGAGEDTRAVVHFKEASRVTVKLLANYRKLQWFYNGHLLATSIIRNDMTPSLYPIVCLFYPGQSVNITFGDPALASSPNASEARGSLPPLKQQQQQASTASVQSVSQAGKAKHDMGGTAATSPAGIRLEFRSDGEPVLTSAPQRQAAENNLNSKAETGAG
uniref:Potassium channel tetramerisation-type BTB domain-containing protein n=1 Tax=Chromera velia CCMP2878 TaxID=1169474 RepID=A0A0G4FAY1_9ALVE|eukprot:Cvel_15967.t1-p1 / transcript=Cvel_15967.t1 / gene=Cvel_15967 / organism=Chromera_velia_CCMP2878 / gene_product=hypothetical protein / transcript_product=hypothetical protein / location=Cvel_scaffold1208:38001-41959(+) / protein_length=475 / sequence_SO=supercontig / SO=protein_coding / is_pseudo=false